MVDLSKFATIATNLGMIALAIYLFRLGDFWAKVAGGFIIFGTAMYFSRKLG